MQGEAIEAGYRLYLSLGCAACHGPEGEGGVANPNYLRSKFPAVKNMAKQLGLTTADRFDRAVGLLAAGLELDEPARMGFSGAGLVAARYADVRDAILAGRSAYKGKREGPEPIPMPGYAGRLERHELARVVAAMLLFAPPETSAWRSEPAPPLSFRSGSKPACIAGLAVLPALAGTAWQGWSVSAWAGWQAKRKGSESAEPFAELPKSANNHAEHEALGIDCVACHFGANRSHRAGLPPLSLCAACHSADRPTPATPAELAEALRQPERFVWPLPAARQPDDVFFSHAAHVRLVGMGCSECHGPADTKAGPLVRPVTMAECMSCHEQRRANNDCLACHR